MKKVDKILKSLPDSTGIDKETADKLVILLNKTYNGNTIFDSQGNSDYLEALKRELRGEIGELKMAPSRLRAIGLSRLRGWLEEKREVWWINQDPEVNPLNNFSKHPVHIEFQGIDHVCKTTEAYFQAAKFFRTDPDWANKILLEPAPSMTKKMGNSRDHELDSDWQRGMAVQRMIEALFAKYRQHQEVRDALAVTTDKHIIERADWDSIWGDGPDGNGKNYLGKCWMFIRSVML